MKEPLSFAERNALCACEAVIERSLETFYEVGTALLKIRDERLYRAKYKTFEEYCKERWGWHRRYADRQIEAACVVQHLRADASQVLSPIGETAPAGSRAPREVLSPMGLIPDNERQARELAPLPAEAQRIAWAEAVEESHGEQPTAAAVATAARRHAQCRVPERKPMGRAGEPPLVEQLRKKHDADLEHHHHLTAIMISIEELAGLKIDLSQVSRSILMADSPRRYETAVAQAHQTLRCLLDAMRRIA